MPYETAPSLAIVFVLYHAYDDMEAFIAAQDGTVENTRLIVIDNTPQRDMDHVALKRMAGCDGVTCLMAEPENLGYSGAADFAMRSLPELRDFDYVAISNTDLSYQVSDVSRTLAETRHEHDGVGAIAPRLTNADGTDKPQLHYVSEPSKAHYARLVRIFSSYPMTVAHRLLGDVKRAVGFGRNQRETPREIFAPHGAFMILTNAYFARTKGFDHPAFLFCEEVFIGAQCRDAGLRCIFEPKIEYAHDNHGAMGAVPSRRIVSYLKDAHEAVLPMLK